MAVSISEALLAAFNNPDRVAVGLFTFEFGINVYGLWTGAGERSYNGVLYKAGGSVLKISNVNQVMDGSVTDLTISLNTLDAKGLTSDILVSFYDEDWHQMPVTLQLGMLDPETRQIVGVRTLFRGRTNTAPFKEGPDSSEISLKCVSRSLDLSEGGGLYRNDSTQRRFDGSDTGLIGIGTLSGAIKAQSKWGQG